MSPFALLVMVVVVALIFEFINGFHDTANAIATVVSTGVLKPRQAIALATACNVVGALQGTTVAASSSQSRPTPRVSPAAPSVSSSRKPAAAVPATLPAADPARIAATRCGAP